MTNTIDSGVSGKRKLHIAGQSAPEADVGAASAFAGLDIDAELKRFEQEERKRLGLDGGSPDQWIEDMANKSFTKTERGSITMLVGGLTIAHDYFVEAGLSGVGYNVQMLDALTYCT